MLDIYHCNLEDHGMMSLLQLLLITSSVHVVCVFSQNASTVHTECHGAVSCGDCLQLAPVCAWCESEGYSIEEEPRCDSEEGLIAKGCAKYSNPATSLETIKNEQLKDVEDNSEAVQVQPQEISLKIRLGETARFNIRVKPAENFPVDLYYVMDLSNSMADDLENLKLLGKTLADEMKTITKKLRLGFGIFVDKTVLPFIYTNPVKNFNERQGDCAYCEEPYSFRNVLPLDENTTAFAEHVKNTYISTNADQPEGGLDALMQAAVCKSQIGWRDKARHLLVYTSDAPFHIAGDGTIGGIISPNSGNCQLNLDTQEYETSNLYDYPSPMHLSIKMKENNIIPIFAVVEGQHHVYKDLSDMIEAATVAVLAGDSSNIVRIVKENYALITEKVELTDTAPLNLELSYTPHCLNDDSTEGTQTCTGIQLGAQVYFEIDVKAVGCLEGGNTSFTIRPIGYDELVTINVEVICSCGCENNGFPNHEYCTSGNGSLVCGECECNEGRFGQSCECSAQSTDEAGGMRDIGSCQRSNSTDDCSGRGDCICGQCVCQVRQNADEVISGKYCECDNFTCPRYKGQLCGGPERGQCECDKIAKGSICKCARGFGGDDCGCPTRTDTCVAEHGLTCNAIGTCECGTCRCDPKSRFLGQTCSDCATCADSRCSSYEPCIQCKIYGGGRLTDSECDMCSLHIKEVDVIPDIQTVSCSFKEQSDNCSVRFKYNSLDEGTIVVYVQKAKECPPPLSPQSLLYLIFGIVFGVVLIGLILALIYKLVTFVQDRGEFIKWEKEKKNVEWEEVEQNPLYKSSVTTYKNPLFKRRNDL